MRELLLASRFSDSISYYPHAEVVIEDMVKEGLSHHALAPGFDAAFLAATVAWAIYGAARRWFQNSHRISAEEMASKIEAMVTPMLLSGQL